MRTARWLVAVWTALATLSAYADGRGYEARTVPIYAGVGVFAPNDPYASNYYTFYVLERRTDVKPLGLSFVNPFAPTGTSRDQRNYWVVDLSRITETQLARYRIILLSRTNWAGMTPEIREKLRRFVDAGGVLWIESAYTTVAPTFNQLLFPEVSFGTGNERISGGNIDHPIFKGYYQLSPFEVVRVGLRGRGLMGGSIGISGNPPLQPILIAGGQPVMAAGIYGSGRIVVSALGIASALNAPFIRGNEFVNRARDYLLESVPDLDLKVAYNIIRWGASSTADAFNARRANAVSDQYGAPLSVRWFDSNSAPVLRDGAPVIYGGLVFATIGDRLVCYDGIPNRDLDGDGRSDDGLLDLEQGEPYDKVWEVRLGSRASPPVIVETPEAILVLVQVETKVFAFRALPRGPEGSIPTNVEPVWTISNPVAGGAPICQETQQIPAPLVIENNLLLVPSYHQVGVQLSAGFVAYLLRGLEPPELIVTDRLADGRWYQPRAGNLGNWLLPPVAGLVPNKGTGGGNDIMVYFGTRARLEANAEQDLLRAFWLGAKGEVLTPVLDQAGQYQGYMRTRISERMRIFGPDNYDPSNQRNPLYPRVYRVNKNDGTFSDITRFCTFNQRDAGSVSLPVGLYGSEYVYLIDYYIDWGYASDAGRMFRSFATLPVDQQGAQFPANRLKGFTLGPNGVLYITTGTDETNPDVANGNLIAVLEQSPPRAQGGNPRGTSRVLWRWQSHGGYTQIIRGSESVPVEGATLWKEPNQALDSFLSLFLRFNHSNNPQTRAMNFTFKHAPVYYDGAVYAIGEGKVRLGGFVELPYTILLAFDAEPEQFVIELGAPIDTEAEIQISQRDYGRSGSSPTFQVANTITYSPNAPDPLIRVDHLSGRISFLGFASAGAGGQIPLLERTLSISQPVVISFGTTQTPLYINPDRIPGSWGNLRWYAVFLGVRAQSSPVVVGDILYLPVVAQFPGAGQTGSGILGIGTDPYRLQPNLAAYKAQAGTIPVPNRDYLSIVRWPYIDDLINESDLQNSPLEFLREFVTRFVQQLRFGGQIASIGAGEGMLVVGTGEGLHAFSRQGTLIADEGRIVEVDSASRVIWSTENTQLEIPSGVLVSSKAKYPLTPNARVYRYGEQELLVVEPERNRVVIIDRAGSEVRTITRFIPDRVRVGDQIVDLRHPNASPPSNYVSGMPETLRSPTDVSVWTEFVPAERNPFVNAQPLEYWIHYTISDSGNSRVVDIVDRYQADPRSYTIGPPVQHPQLGPMLGVLYWTTPSIAQGRNYKYISTQRFEYWDGQQTRIGFATLVQNVAVEGYLTAGGSTPDVDPATPEAGMITLQLIVSGYDRTIYIRKMRLPDGKVVPILGPVSIDTSRRSLVGNARGLFLLVTTSTGVYELEVPLTGTIGDTLNVTWMLTNEAYSYGLRRKFEGHDLALNGEGTPLQPILFRPAQARYLLNGNVLIVNSYSGETQVLVSNQPETRVFPGEVLEVRASDFNPSDTDLSDGTLNGFGPNSILWSTADRPKMSGSSSLRRPTSADRGF